MLDQRRSHFPQKIVVIGCLLAMTTACVSSSRKAAFEMSQFTSLPVPAPSSNVVLRPLYKEYPVSAAGSAQGPVISKVQHRWIDRIVHSSTYGPLRSQLRFAVARGVKTPIVVWQENRDLSGVDHGGHVIGEYCSVYFNPFNQGLFAASQAACSPPTPKPVR